MNRMVIKFENESIIFDCPGLSHKDAQVNESVMTYHSYAEAKKAGWIFTKCERFSSNGKMVGVCPECSKDIC